MFETLETFHSQTENGVRQELFAILVMCVIARLLMVLASPHQNATPVEPQFKHAMMTLATDAACLVCDRPDRALMIFHEVLTEIARARYYKPKKPRPAYPRFKATNLQMAAGQSKENQARLIQQHCPYSYPLLISRNQ